MPCSGLIKADVDDDDENDGSHTRNKSFVVHKHPDLEQLSTGHTNI